MVLQGLAGLSPAWRFFEEWGSLENTPGVKREVTENTGDNIEASVSMAKHRDLKSRVFKHIHTLVHECEKTGVTEAERAVASGE